VGVWFFAGLSDCSGIGRSMCTGEAGHACKGKEDYATLGVSGPWKPGYILLFSGPLQVVRQRTRHLNLTANPWPCLLTMRPQKHRGKPLGHIRVSYALPRSLD